jgi:hypothetical protein
MSTRISARGGDGNISNGGTVKLFYDTFQGAMVTDDYAGRVFDAGAGSFHE